MQTPDSREKITVMYQCHAEQLLMFTWKQKSIYEQKKPVALLNKREKMVWLVKWHWIYICSRRYRHKHGASIKLQERN